MISMIKIITQIIKIIPNQSSDNAKISSLYTLKKKPTAFTQ
jgi:hypothetical protein